MSEQTESLSSALFDVSEMCVIRDGMSIFGRIYVPDVMAEKMPAVILSHSANMTSDSMISYCERIAAQGMVAYAFDFCGGSKASRSDGDQADMTVFTEVEDLKAVLKAVSELDYVDSQNIYLFGTSQGGLVSALTAEECSSIVKGLMLFYPAFNIAEMAQKYGGVIPGNAETAFISSLADFDVYDQIGDFEGDVLILHGTKDFIVSSSYSEKAAEIYQHCELHLIEGASHGFNKDNYAVFGDYDEETWCYVETFLDEHISK
ncbi:MAG: alpha/beta hydrolase [Coprococcus sp.]